LYENIIFYIDCRRTNGTTMLKSADHDSMSGEHVGTTSGMTITSGKSEIWPWEAPENQGFRSCENSQGGKKDLGKSILLLNSICEEAGRCLVCWGKETIDFSLLL
jgi:hypothetical protein